MIVVNHEAVFRALGKAPLSFLRTVLAFDHFRLVLHKSDGLNMVLTDDQALLNHEDAVYGFLGLLSAPTSPEASPSMRA